MRTRNFRFQSDVVERGSVTKSQKGKNACVERKVGECFHWKAHGQCSKGDSCSFNHDIQDSGTVALARDGKDDRLLPHPIRRKNRLTARDKNPQRSQAIKMKSSSDKRSEIP